MRHARSKFFASLESRREIVGEALNLIAVEAGKRKDMDVGHRLPVCAKWGGAS